MARVWARRRGRQSSPHPSRGPHRVGQPPVQSSAALPTASPAPRGLTPWLPALVCRYHRVLKKSRRRKALKEFELLQKSDPEAALARLEELEQLRMQVLLLGCCPSPGAIPARGAAPADAAAPLPPGADEPEAPEQGKMGALQGCDGEVRPGGELAESREGSAWEGPWKSIQSSPPALGGDSFRQTKLRKAPSSLTLNAAGVGELQLHGAACARASPPASRSAAASRLT